MRTRLQIEPSEHETIFAQLCKKRKHGRPPTWSTRRAGWKIRIWPLQTEQGVKVAYQMSSHLRTVNQIAVTLTRAIAAINDVLLPKPVQIAPPETMPLVAPPRRQEWASRPVAQEWLPYADN